MDSVLFFVGGFLTALAYLVIALATLWCGKNIVEKKKFKQENARLRELLAKNKVSTHELVAESGESAQRDQKLTELNTRQKEFDTVKSEFVSVAAHQLRTPLTGLKWILHSLSEEEFGKLNANYKKAIRQAESILQSTILLINDLLTVAWIEEGRFDYQFTKQHVEPLVRYALKKCLTHAKKKDISLVSKISRRLPLILADAEKIKIVLENLIENAIIYTASSGEVSVQVREHDGAILIEVTDNGIGIPEEQQRYIFSKFFRARNAVLFETSGSGLGLYTVKNIIEKHHGTISFESVEKSGTTFIITLPTGKSQISDETVATPQGKASTVLGT